MHKTLKNWRARRSGNGMTVYGELTVDGKPSKITDVVAIWPDTAGAIIATDRGGIEHILEV